VAEPERIFGTDGIRGPALVGWLSEEMCTRLGAALASLARMAPERFGAAGAKARIVIARDTRPSGPAMVDAFAAGVTGGGCELIDLGVAPTGALAARIAVEDAVAGAVVSASHNPAGDNGIKLFDASASKLGDELELELEAMLRGERDVPGADVPRGVRLRRGHTDVLDGYAAWLARHLEALEGGMPELAGRRVVVDCAEGAASAFAPELLRQTGADVVAISSSGDGARINEGCGALHPEVLAAAVAAEGADLGLAFDGDADRLIVVDERGTIRDGDHILLVLGCDLHARGRLHGHRVVGTVMSNLGLEHALGRHDVELVRTAVGDRHVVAAMVEGELVLGGEQAGHIVIAGPPPLVGDGLLVALHVLAVLQRSGQSFSELCAELEPCPQELINVVVARKPPFDQEPTILAAVSRVEERMAGRGRVLLRYSGTEPKARVMVEGEVGVPVAELAAELAAAVADALG
jgi:phosphoglucosamine mutase